MAAGAVMLASCTKDTTKGIERSGSGPDARTSDTRWPIKRVVYLMLENRSFDCVFGRFPGANGTTVGLDLGKERPLIRCPEWLPGDLPHDLAAALKNHNGGELDGFAQGIYGPYYGYSQHDRMDVPNYWHWAENYVLCDNFFASAMGPSYPNHLFFIAGTSGGTIDNPENIEVKFDGDLRIKSWGCDAYGEDVFVLAMDPSGNLAKHSTCFELPTVGEQLTAATIDWAYYAAQPYQVGYIWNAYTAVGNVFHTDAFDEHIRPVDDLVTDIAANALPPVTWITPLFQLSDHPPWSTCHAHNWITDVVNGIMRSDMWKETAIFITWDEWGGFYDHVEPPMIDSFGLGFRVPMLVISPYAKRGYVDDAQGEFTSPLRFVSDNWGLDYLTPRIANTHNFEHVFDFDARPRPPDPRPRSKDCDGEALRWIGEFDEWPESIEPADEPAT